MISPSQPIDVSSREHLVTKTLAEITAQEITVELVDPEEEARWNKLIRQHHYLNEHRLVGESLRYVAQQNGQWIALLGWSSAAFHLGPRDTWIGWTAAQRKAGRHLLASRFSQNSNQRPFLRISQRPVLLTTAETLTGTDGRWRVCRPFFDCAGCRFCAAICFALKFR